MHLIYNDVILGMAEITEYTRENVYSPDGVDLLYTKHRLTAVLHTGPNGYPTLNTLKAPMSKSNPLYPDTTEEGAVRNGILPRSNTANNAKPSDLFIHPDSNLAPLLRQSQPGFMMTDVELRYRLMQPRKKLIVTVPDVATNRDTVWVQCPRYSSHTAEQVATGGSQFSANTTETVTKTTKQVSDVANGPTPMRLDVIQPTGNGMSMALAYTIEFNLAPTNADNERLILSHRWQTTHSSDEDQYLIRTIDGIVIAHGELLRQANKNLDWYRNQFFHPIPNGFHRSIPSVTQSTDGLTIKYQIVDRDPHCRFDAGDTGATFISIHENVNTISPDVIGLLEKAVGESQFWKMLVPRGK